MSGAYTDYLATFTFRPSSFGNVSGLGTQARTAGAVILGGPRAGAGSAYRIYNYLNIRNPNFFYIAKAGLQDQFAQANNYAVTNNSRNYAFAF